VYPEVMPAACERCGICAAECPQHAIDLRDLSPQEMIDRLGTTVTAASPNRSPYILVFGCSRSGNQAAKLASLVDHDLPKGMKIIEVPCAGSLSLGHILSGFQHGADGILVLTCHEGNCHSRRGNSHAHSRVDHLKTELEQIGYDAKRLEIHTLASNMGGECATLIQCFAKKMMEIGPSPLVRSSAD
jgi:coenzyme F420-reducing hydrogenase delta subunit